MDLFILPERERPMPPPSLLREIDAYAVTAGEISHNEIQGKRFNRVYILPGVTLSPEVEDAAEFCLYGAHSKESAFIYGVDAQEDWEMAKRLMQKLKPPVPKIPLEIQVSEAHDLANFSIKLAATGIALSVLIFLMQLAAVLRRM